MSFLFKEDKFIGNISENLIHKIIPNLEKMEKFKAGEIEILVRKIKSETLKKILNNMGYTKQNLELNMQRHFVNVMNETDWDFFQEEKKIFENFKKMDFNSLKENFKIILDKKLKKDFYFSSEIPYELEDYFFKEISLSESEENNLIIKYLTGQYQFFENEVEEENDSSIPYHLPFWNNDEILLFVCEIFDEDTEFYIDMTELIRKGKKIYKRKKAIISNTYLNFKKQNDEILKKYKETSDELYKKLLIVNSISNFEHFFRNYISTSSQFNNNIKYDIIEKDSDFTFYIEKKLRKITDNSKKDYLKNIKGINDLITSELPKFLYEKSFQSKKIVISYLKDILKIGDISFFDETLYSELIKYRNDIIHKCGVSSSGEIAEALEVSIFEKHIENLNNIIDHIIKIDYFKLTNYKKLEPSSS